jgi:hypothetical protein
MTRAKDPSTYFVTLRDDHGERKNVLTVKYLCRREKGVLDCLRMMVVTPFENGNAKQEIWKLAFRDNSGKVFQKMELNAEKSINNFFLGTADGGHQFHLQNSPKMNISLQCPVGSVSCRDLHLPLQHSIKLGMRLE